MSGTPNRTGATVSWRQPAAPAASDAPATPAAQRTFIDLCDGRTGVTTVVYSLVGQHGLLELHLKRSGQVSAQLATTEIAGWQLVALDGGELGNDEWKEHDIVRAVPPPPPRRRQSSGAGSSSAPPPGVVNLDGSEDTEMIVEVRT
jgi:hypothetical protein